MICGRSERAESLVVPSSRVQTWRMSMKGLDGLPARVPMSSQS
jgi:hypothetical protein